MRTITTITTCALLAACALLALALATACTPHAADDPAAAHPVPLMPTATLAQATTAQPTRGAVVSRLSSSSEVALPRETGEYGGGEYPDRGEVVGKATRTTTRASVPITLTRGTLNLTMNGVENPYTLSANGALTSTTPHSVIGADTRTFSVGETTVTATTASPNITGIAPDSRPTNASLPMNLGVVMPSQELLVAANGAVTLPLVHTTAGMRLVLKMDVDVLPTSVVCNSTGEVAPLQVTTSADATANTASCIVMLDVSSSPSVYGVAFGMLTANTDIKAGDLLAMIDIATPPFATTTKTLALIAPAPLQLSAGQMVTYTVHVGHSVASITGVGITEFEPGNENGEDLSTDVAIADGTAPLDPKIFNEKNPVWVITGDGADEEADNLILGNVAEALNGSNGTPSPGSIHLILPNFAGSIGYEAFDNCTALASISAPKVTGAIGSVAFGNCTALTSISMPGVTGAIGQSAFDGCAALTTISLPRVTDIGNYAFDGCSALTSVSLPEVTGIGNSAFDGCTALKRLELTQSTEKMIVHKDAFGGVTTANITLVLNKSVEGNTEATIGVKIEEITDPSDPNAGKKKVTFLNTNDGGTDDATFTFAAVEYLSS